MTRKPPPDSEDPAPEGEEPARSRPVRLGRKPASGARRREPAAPPEAVSRGEITAAEALGEPRSLPGREELAPLPPDALYVVPLRNTVLFPGALAPLAIGRPSSVRAVEDAIRRERPLAFLAQRDPTVEEPEPEHLHSVGTTAEVVNVLALPGGQHHVLVQGKKRFRVAGYVRREPPMAVLIEMIEPVVPDTKEFQARVFNLREQALRGLSLLPRPMPELASAVENIQDPVLLVDVIGSSLDIPFPEKQDLLETFDLDRRVQKVTEKLARQIEILDLTRKISTETRGSLEKAQREFFLREQLKAIQKELGEKEGPAAEIEQLREKVRAAGMPPEVDKQAQKELSRLEHMSEASAEYSVVRTYIDWLIDLPWSQTTEEQIDLKKARAILDEDHHGLEKVKRRIVEFLAVRKLNPAGKSPILCFVGPPGVGKTSLGKSIARAINRRFVRQSLGGVHDEAEIRGHRRTYVGALPGRIIQGLRKAGTRNPVFMLDEIDKLSASFEGDPNAALLEVLDPEQNFSFEDHYLGVPFDLRQVMFITTANIIDHVPGPLRDRMEVIELPGYTEEEKVVIARRYLIPRQIEGAGLGTGTLGFEDAAIREIIRSYTREAGVRQIEREISAICRAVATRVAQGEGGAMTIGPANVPSYLGPPKFVNEAALRTSLPGVATGVAWTPTGGDILFVEATKMAGEGELILTGQLGDVMRESAVAALSVVKSRAEKLGIDPEGFKKIDLHIHIPAGAIPKDGPSAGVTMFVALTSLLLGRCVRHDVAMTGEISLRGLVLPVGGIKEKVLAARRAGLASILIPDLNRKDLEDVPPEVREAMHFRYLVTVDDAIEHAFEPVGAAAPA